MSSTGPSLKQLSGSLHFLFIYHSNYNEWRSQVENGVRELINFDIVLHNIVIEKKYKAPVDCGLKSKFILF